LDRLTGGVRDEVAGHAADAVFLPYTSVVDGAGADGRVVVDGLGEAQI